MPPRVIVIGAGIVGAAAAYRLASAGAAVTVVDAGTPASGASGRSFGWINASFYLNEAHFRLRREAIEAHRRLDEELGGSGVAWTGSLWWEEEGAAFDAARDRLAALGYPIRELDSAEVKRICPHIGRLPDRALAFPSEGCVDAAGLVRRLLTAARLCGTHLLTGVEVEAVAEDSGRVTGVVTAQGRLSADAVLVAAGTGTQALLAQFALSLPMLTRPGLLLRSRPVPRVLDRILVTPEIEVRQEGDGRLLAPAGAGHQGNSASSLSERVDILAAAGLARLRALFPSLDLEWDEATVAFRPVPGDGLPVVGRVGPSGLYVAVMHSGVTLAPLIAERLSDEILLSRDDPGMTPFRWPRPTSV